MGWRIYLPAEAPRPDSGPTVARPPRRASPRSLPRSPQNVTQQIMLALENAERLEIEALEKRDEQQKQIMADFRAEAKKEARSWS